MLLFDSEKKKQYSLALIFLFGLLIRLMMVQYTGHGDMNGYFNRGMKVLQIGLSKAYIGNYFPLQYQIFAFSAWLSLVFKVDFWIIFKITNLIFDSGIFLIFIALLKRLGHSPLWVALYWLNPYILQFFSLGYCDFQQSFFIMATIYLLLKSKRFTDYIISGIPSGLALLMKPQSLMPFVTATLFILFQSLRRRKVDGFGFLIFPLILFCAYTFYFLCNQRGLLLLAATYKNAANIMPCLNAHMYNIWYPIAYLMKEPGARIWSVPDTILILPFLQARTLAIFLAVGSIVAYLVLISFKSQLQKDNFAILPAITFSSFAVPFLMTSAHENHLFLSVVLLMLMAVHYKNIWFRSALIVLVLIQYINIACLYGQEKTSLFIKAALDGYGDPVRITLAVFSLVPMSLIYHFMFRIALKPDLQTK
ncbi:hypothetical protein JW998_17460 [candidate division KSB1 bacterium]|nr:hypothetical protein [candidate division KSB1 bacterium]